MQIILNLYQLPFTLVLKVDLFKSSSLFALLDGAVYCVPVAIRSTKPRFASPTRSLKI